MVEKQAIMRLNKEFVLLQQSHPDQFRACPSERDTLTWYYVVHNLPVSTPYHGGQYFGKLVFPREYPLKPPSIYMITPSGRFEVNTRLCLSMSDYHPESWNPSWRVETILLGLISFMTDESDPMTTGGVIATFQARREFALMSFFRNMRNKEFVKHFPDFSNPTKYVIGMGFCSTEGVGDVSRNEKHLRLVDVGLDSDEMGAIESTEGLRALLRHHNVSGYESQSCGSNFVLSGSGSDKLAWVAVGVLVCAWLYTQIKQI